MTVTKQSLIDWEVTNNGAHVAWITKLADDTYKICFPDDKNEYEFLSFTKAKEFVFGG